MNKKDLHFILEQVGFSELDIHFARLMARLSGEEMPELLLAAALVSRATSKGDVCLDLSSVEGKPLMTEEPETPTFSCPALRKWRKKLDSSAVIGRPGDYTPLVLDDKSRLYLYRYWDYEKKLADNLKRRASAEIVDIDLLLLKDGLSRLFRPTQDGATDWQKIAAFVSVVKRFCVISGGPGTGKSSIIAKILALILEQSADNKIRTALAAPTGKAAARLQEAIKHGKEGLPVKNHIKEAIVCEASTIHRLLGTIPDSPYFRHNAENLLPVDLVVIDEASMVDLALMSKLVQAIPPDARLILLGDKDQLASVEAGAMLGDICDTGRVHGFSQTFYEKCHDIMGDPFDSTPSSNGPKIQDCVVQLKKSYRFGTHSGINAVSQAINQGDGHLALTLLKSREYDDIRWKSLSTSESLHRSLREKIVRGYRPYAESKDPISSFRMFERFRLICALRKGPYGVAALNSLAEQILREEGLINPDYRWYRGRPVIVTKNDYDLGLFNGDTGTIFPDPGSNHDLRAFFLSPDGALRKFLPIKLPDHETVYAMTVHKSQGSEFESLLLLLPDKYAPVLTRELIYTGITRAKKHVEIWGTESVFLEAIKNPTQRASGLRDALWGVESLSRVG